MNKSLLNFHNFLVVGVMFIVFVFVSRFVLRKMGFSVPFMGD